MSTKTRKKKNALEASEMMEMSNRTLAQSENEQAPALPVETEASRTSVPPQAEDPLRDDLPTSDDDDTANSFSCVSFAIVLMILQKIASSALDVGTDVTTGLTYINGGEKLNVFWLVC